MGLKNQGTDKHILITYDCVTGTFHYPESAQTQFGVPFDDRPLWQVMEEEALSSGRSARQMKSQLEEMAAAREPVVEYAEYFLKNANRKWTWYRVGFLAPVPGTVLYITLTDIDCEKGGACQQEHVSQYDSLTGLPSYENFVKRVEFLLDQEQADGADAHAMLYFDVLRFKAINDIFGMEEGDRLLKFIADAVIAEADSEDAICRQGADRFVIFTHRTGTELEEGITRLFEAVHRFDLPFEITCNVGVYVTTQERLTVDQMIDRAVLAQSSIKGSYTIRHKYYTEELRKEMLGEQEIAGMMGTALAERQFVVYYQPQYNHSTGMLMGAEALVRWSHPERGLISPGVFISIFEKNGFITKLDMFVFEEVCAFLRKCMDQRWPLVPISSNFSRQDIFQTDFVEQLEVIRKKYDVPVKYLRVEITESAIMGSSQQANEIVKKLHRYGYVVEMDDFGSGYSSLNVLKDIESDVIKLDMLFLSKTTENDRGGTILSSVVRMAKWLGMPVIAEGVETVEQADFLRSIGCEHIQGYLYSRPLAQQNYEELLSGDSVGAAVPEINLLDQMNASDFWNPSSQETLIFSNYVGGAAIFDYHDGKVEILRVNKKYLQEICMNLSEKDLIQSDPMEALDEENKKIYLAMLEQAIATGLEQECVTWREFSSSCCGSEKMCIRTNVRMIGRSGDSCLFYAMIRNITTEMSQYHVMLDAEKRFRMASEQVNIYFWEYTIATREMRPCFRCMRDLGLPPLLTNYPDSAIERGIFPPEVADMYRDWHRQIAEGVPELEAVIPLTMDRVPFRVRYTTEFDENGQPVKAYGSAALVV